MVSETLQKIREAEEKAQRIITLSKEGAQKIISTAQHQAKELILRTKEGAISEAKSDFEASIKLAHIESKKLLDETETEIIALKKRAVSNFKTATDFIIEKLMRT